MKADRGLMPPREPSRKAESKAWLVVAERVMGSARRKCHCCGLVNERMPTPRHAFDSGFLPNYRYPPAGAGCATHMKARVLIHLPRDIDERSSVLRSFEHDHEALTLAALWLSQEALNDPTDIVDLWREWKGWA